MSRRSALMTPTAALAVLVIGALAGCAAEPPVPTATPTPTETVTISPTGDGVLRLGTLFPSSGEFASLGPGQVAAVEVAVREINEAGGVLGKPVEVLHRDSGAASVDKIDLSMADLVARGVDVIIGPSSSQLAQRIIPAAVDAKIAIISPAAADAGLTTADDSGFFFRTIPSSALQGTALGHVLPESSAGKVALIHSDDAAGTAVSESLSVALGEHDGTLVASEPLAAASGATAVATSISNAKPDAVVIATAGIENLAALIPRLAAAGISASKLWLTGENLGDYSQSLPAGALDGAHGIGAGTVPDEEFVARLAQADPAVSDTRYAAEAYDATIAAALAAIVVGDDAGVSISLALQSVTSSGVPCHSFGECLDVLTTQSNIDYDGISGPLDFDTAGDVTAADYELFTYGPENRYSRVETWVWE